MEIKTPKVVAKPTEGGTNVFPIEYFGRKAYLAQSPQFYKQAGVGSFERVFEVGPVFRAEPHATTRHMNEYTSMDAEMGFIQSLESVMNQLEYVIKRIAYDLSQKAVEPLALYDQQMVVPDRIPRIALSEAAQILQRKYGKKLEDDMDADGERLICDHVRKEHRSDFVFLTHYPAPTRPFYTMPSTDGRSTESFDLLYRGTEIATGGQRIHDYFMLVESIKRHGLNPLDFASYTELFKHGMPPHGGWGMGLERVVQLLLGLENVREATLFPRDMHRLAP